MPEIIMVDEIGTEAEALACRTIAERGVQLVATAHGQLLENLIKNPTLSDLVGGIQSVTLGMLSLWTCNHCVSWATTCGTRAVGKTANELLVFLQWAASMPY